MSESPSLDEATAILDPIWNNTQWVKDTLGLYEGVSKHAEELNIKFGYFFGLVQKISLDHTVLGICRLFDKSNPAYVKDTIPDLFSYLSARLTGEYVIRLKIDVLTELGISSQTATELLAGFRTKFDTTKPKFLKILESLLPNRRSNTALKQLFTYRDKKLAHQERLNKALADQLKYLPSVHEIEKLNNWAYNFLLLANNMLTNRSIVPNGRSARIASLTVTAKLLGRKFDGPSDRESFFAPI